MTWHEAMLMFSNQIMCTQITQHLIGYNPFHNFTNNACQRDRPIVCHITWFASFKNWRDNWLRPLLWYLMNGKEWAKHQWHRFSNMFTNTLQQQCARGKGSSPGRVEGSSRAMLATARLSCINTANLNVPSFVFSYSFVFTCAVYIT